MEERVPSEPPANSEERNPHAREDPMQHKARMEAILRESHENLLDAIREHDETMREFEKKKGILERLFGYRTSV